MNFTKISNQTFLGKLLRYPLKFIPSDMIFPILQGALKGRRWIVGSGQHGYWLGNYELEKQKIFGKTITKGSIVFDLGAHVGFYTLLSSLLVGEKGKVIAFEPLQRNLYYLKQHLKINQIKNVKVIETAVSNCSGVEYLEYSENSFECHISNEGKFLVKTVSLDELIDNRLIPLPDFIKIDIEGAEMLVLSGAKLTILESFPTIFLSTHGVQIKNKCSEFLSSLGYDLQPIGNSSLELTDEILAFKAD